MWCYTAPTQPSNLTPMLMRETQWNAVGHTHTLTHTDDMKIERGLEKKEFAESPIIYIMLPQLWHLRRGLTLVPCRLSGSWFRICEFLWVKLVVSVGFPMMFLTPWFLQSLLPLLIGEYPNVWPWISQSASICHWLKALMTTREVNNPQRIVSSGYAPTAARSFSWGHACRLPEVPLESDFYLTL